MTVMEPDQIWTELRAKSPGYAYVTSVECGADRTVVRLSYSTGETSSLDFPVCVDPVAATAPRSMARLLSIQIRNLSTVSCIALGTSRSGPCREPIELREALALAASGVHTVVMSACADRPGV